MTTITITCTDTQAECITQALELYVRLGLGQFEEIPLLFREGLIRGHDVDCTALRVAMISNYCEGIKATLGHPLHGSFGIGSPQLHPMTQRAFEIKKQIEKALALHRNPNPSFPTVDYDGRIVRYTEDPDIAVSVSDSNKESKK